jgi:hypothetical protein
MPADAKIFCLGAHKTGTTSLMEALTILGFELFPEQQWYDDWDLQQSFFAGNHGPVFDLIEKFDAFKDTPFNHSDFFKELHSRYPTALYILTLRDEDELIASHRRWNAVLESEVFPNDQHLKAVAAEFWRREYGQEVAVGDEDFIKATYRARNESILDFFRQRSQQLLVFDLTQESDPWGKLCEFVKRPVPATTVFPHANRTQ